ncbi:hypothetical protein LINGRAHAP2_LOCUS30735, partial [Linum grandiflorum]
MVSSSGQSSNVGGRGKTNDSLRLTTSVYCNCSMKARLLYSWTANNPIRRFYRCRND